MLMLAALCLSACGGPDGDIDQQLQLLAEQRAVWLTEREEPLYGACDFAVTDLDHNGRLELIVTSIQGMDARSHSDFYEVNGTLDSLTLCTADWPEDCAQPDLLGQELITVYFDEEQVRYYYIFADYTAVSAEESVQGCDALWLQDGAVGLRTLARAVTVHRQPDDRVDWLPSTRYYDEAGQEINEAQYEATADGAFAGMERQSVLLGWLGQPFAALRDLDGEALCALLRQSYDRFSGNEV